MSQLQNQVKTCVDDIEDALASSNSLSSNEVHDRLSATYQRFLQHVWCEVPMNSADGSALATVSCMPIWELLNQYTSACALSAAPEKAIAVQLLSSMYPKSKDRRCVFQQPSCYGSNSQTAVPLSTHVPLQMFVLNNSNAEQNLEYAKAAQRILRIATVGNYTDVKESAAVASAVRTFINNVLPRCTLISHPGELPKQTRGEVHILWDSPTCDWSSGRIFLLTLWCLLVAAEYLSLPEARNLSLFLCSSRWSTRLVEVDGRKVSYSELLSPLLDICSLCLSVNPRSASVSVDTVPLIDPRIMLFLMGSGITEEQCEIGADFATEYSARPATEGKRSLTLRRADCVKEQLTENIPNEIGFMGTSSSCRDFDQLAYLCRDCLFVPTAKNIASGISASRRRDMLFNRKRTRATSSSDGPCFIPVKSVVTNMLEKTDTDALVTLERLCCKWREDTA
ncbi:conserved hypothetical protein [Leishmania mexicana MHOM/GT/2001/U1103]|uniref:Uncharacterized protein n=1 Tax=Leishmania mexicana (strain MHOM/GT/2001/U1103) TaxID=929439 RepID=E9AKR4_LEIMU|nr:conserved hypothetical protein [Leishmania mexicana MHOM/GT/2001/U1103]CBZ23515.1 conserved hypothetical protein [Leishmania mexicana MHOM/GT/2001/U1103]